MKTILTIMAYELRRLVRSRSNLLNMFLLPLVLIFLLGSSLSSVMGGKAPSSIEQVRVAIVNPTNSGGSEASGMLAELLKLPELKEQLIPLETESREEAESGLRTGKYGYAVIVPPGFDEKVRSGGQAQLEFILGKDRTDNLVAGTVFDNFLDTLNYTQSAMRVLGPAVLTAAAAPGVEGDSVQLGELGKGGRSYTASQFYAVSMTVMFLLYSGLTVTISLFNEKENHTLFRLSSMPVKASQLFIGKMLGIAVITIFQGTTLIVLTNLLFGVDWGNRPLLLILFCLLIIIASLTLSVVITLFSKTGASARSVITVIIVGMTFISGGMAPLPEAWVNSAGVFTINHWALQAILKMMLHTELAQILPNLLVLSLICVALFAAAIFSYRKVGYHG
ncbi:hypothetical protein GCM10010912_52660 [Paenibacillus albidus]|uniref:ABC transmembrane type-2 domain-containing protein n=1 Tax=Paenibacillus albidus TaxID=2041023 RepID=A0A917FT99_9BACL|nr:ABC transporter permease [Paenibacillus albidus]GGG01279.1 hypothetical protein GCM10010912_52660 [Paenibacillus albidus]